MSSGKSSNKSSFKKPDPVGERVDVAIAGAGLAGLTLAALLGRAGLSVVLCDKGPVPEALSRVRPTGRTVALMRPSIGALEKTGAWQRCAASGGALRAMRLIDDSRAEIFPVARVEFRANEVGLREFGVNMPNTVLRAALAESVAQTPGVRFLAGRGFDGFSVTETDVQVNLEESGHLRARLLVGADGALSAVRAAAGIAVKTHDYGQSALTCLISHDHSHENVSTEFHRPTGPFALVPLPGKMSSVVWVEPQERADEIMTLDSETFRQALERRSAGLLGGIRLETPPERWPIRRLRAHRLTAPRVALIAEAAHVMSPITAQGLNLSLRDVADLADTLISAARTGVDPGARAVLERYETCRMPDVRSRVMGTDAINRLVSTNKILPWLARQAGYRALEACGPLRRAAIRQGLASAS